MELYKTEKINPLGGCLPILVQIPVFIALYWVLLESVEMRHAPWILWIRDLSAQDPYYILPLIMGVSMYAQQLMNPQPLDPIQKKVFMFMPLMFTVFFLFFPAGPGALLGGKQHSLHRPAVADQPQHRGCREIGW